MKKTNISIILMILLTLIFTSSAYSLTNNEIKQKIIQQSIMNYPGKCACPYNTMNNGRRCGGRSAYSKSGGYSLICYPSDVTQEMIERYNK